MYQKCLDKVRNWLARLTEGPRKRRQRQWEFTAEVTRKLLDEDAHIKRLISWEAYCEHHGIATNGGPGGGAGYVSPGGGGCSSPPQAGGGGRLFVTYGPDAGTYIEGVHVRPSAPELELGLRPLAFVATGAGGSGGSSRPKEWDFTGPCPWWPAWEEGDAIPSL